MIQANEFRIGNWVREYDGAPTQMTSEMFIEPFISRLRPITITPETLLKCGFKKDDFGPTDDYTWFLPVDPSDENNLLGKMSLTESFEYKFRDEYRDRSIKIESVHQLQNLYLDLYREELSITLY